jgi:hypothetical protein
MEHRRSGWWIGIGAVFVVLVAPVLIGAGVVIGARVSDDTAAPSTSTRVTTTTTAAPTVAAGELADDQLAALEADGEVRTMVDLHQAMMDHMRVTATPQMLQLMNADPMWQMMRSGQYISLLEEHEENIDQMLARGG